MAILLIILPASLHAQETDREQVLADDIIMPGGRPDDSWRDAPKMAYDPHPDKHFRRSL